MRGVINHQFTSQQKGTKNGEKENITTIPQNLTDAVHELTESLEIDLAEKRIEKYSLNEGGE